MVLEQGRAHRNLMKEARLVGEVRRLVDTLDMSSRGSRLCTERGVQEAVIASEVRGAPADSVQRAHSGASPVLLGMGAHRFWLPRHAMSAWRTGAFNRRSAVRKTGG